MKKLLFLLSLAVAGTVAHAQSGALKINNNNTTCGLWVYMFAVDPGFGNGTPCDIAACPIYLPPVSSVTYGSTSAFHATAGGPGYCYMNNTMSFSDFVATQTFQWNEAQFQWDCPIPPCQTNSGWVLADPNAIIAGLVCYGWMPSVASWSGFSCTAATSTWTSSGAAVGALDDMVLDFN